MTHLNIKISGRVQGVFFRQSAKETADVLYVKGFARNEPDDTVYIEAEGEEENLRKFLDWCKRGPDSATVEKVDAKEDEMRNFSEFRTI